MTFSNKFSFNKAALNEPSSSKKTARKATIWPQVHWQKLAVRTTVWLSAEIVLGAIGIDHLADYSEFLLQQQQTLMQATEVVTRLIS